ncbi:hypothetical protein ACVWY5_001147 [Bradyrhizobium sp. USDA 3256]
MRTIARERRRFGYRRLHVLLKREGYVINHKKLFRLYREEKLAVRRRGGRKRAIGTRAPMMVPMAPNDRWSLDFVSDQLTDGRRFRILTVVDDCTRECLALVADTSLSGTRVARELDRLTNERGKPRMVVSDDGTELTSNAILTWADQRAASPGTTSRRASPCRTPSSRASTAGYGTSCSTRRCSRPWPRPVSHLVVGGPTTTMHDRTHSSDGRHHLSSPSPATRVGIWRYATPKAPRQLPSLPPPARANPTAGANSELDKSRGQGHRKPIATRQVLEAVL